MAASLFIASAVAAPFTTCERQGRGRPNVPGSYRPSLLPRSRRGDRLTPRLRRLVRRGKDAGFISPKFQRPLGGPCPAQDGRPRRTPAAPR